MPAPDQDFPIIADYLDGSPVSAVKFALVQLLSLLSLSEVPK